MKNREFIYIYALRFLSMLKKGKQIKNKTEIERLNFTMEQLETFIYEERKASEKRL